MYTKKVTITKTSCRGKKFTCTQTVHVYTDEEKQDKYEKRLAELRAETERRQKMELARNYSALHPTTMSDIMDAIDEYMSSIYYE